MLCYFPLYTVIHSIVISLSAQSIQRSDRSRGATCRPVSSQSTGSRHSCECGVTGDHSTCPQFDTIPSNRAQNEQGRENTKTFPRLEAHSLAKTVKTGNNMVILLTGHRTMAECHCKKRGFIYTGLFSSRILYEPELGPLSLSAFNPDTDTYISRTPHQSSIFFVVTKSGVCFENACV